MCFRYIFSKGVSSVIGLRGLVVVNARKGRVVGI
jgi:hypothetical protein